MAKSNSFGFGDRLRAARERAGMTGAALGQGAGEDGKDVSKASVSDWEHERHYPKADQLRVICLKLNISADELILGDIRAAQNLAQAESALKALTLEQRNALLSLMQGPVAVEKRIDPAPKAYRSKNIEPYHPAKAKPGKSQSRK